MAAWDPMLHGKFYERYDPSGTYAPAGQASGKRKDAFLRVQAQMQRARGHGPRRAKNPFDSTDLYLQAIARAQSDAQRPGTTRASLFGVASLMGGKY